MTIHATKGCHKFPFEEKFKILGYAMNRHRTTPLKTECSPRTSIRFFLLGVRIGRGLY